jgi:ubiquinone/menaquinone biosynthesis C-methylase UbiE
MSEAHESFRRAEVPPAEWARLHDAAARDYKVSEWSRETLFGIREQRRKLFGPATGNVLDVACGYGMNFAWLPLATHVTGVELSPVMLDMARERVRTLGLAVDLREGNAEALDFPDNSFDTVISALSTCSFMHPVTALREMRRVCRPGGRIRLLEHGRSSWEWAGRFQDRHAADMLKQSGCHWNQEPQQLVVEAGLRITRAERAFFGVFHMIEANPAKAA